MQAQRQRRGPRGRRETPDNKVPQVNPETRGSLVMPAERAKRAVKGKRAATEIKDGLEIRDEREIRGVPATRDEKASRHRVQPENIAIQILIPEKPVALKTTDFAGNSRFQVQTSK
jgi:hypothetical protein